MEADRVECYSGARYAERPVAVWWQGERLAVESVERAWRTTGGPAFIVRAGRRFQLTYSEADDRWTVRLIDSES